jgi:tRNA-dependent cyclodipeptide synthase
MSAVEMSHRIYAPVCLYPHTKYRTTEGLANLFRTYEFHKYDYLIVIADRLLALDKLVTGRYWSHGSVFRKARAEAVQIFNLIRRISRQAKAQATGRIVYWDEIAETENYRNFSQRMCAGFLAEPALRGSLEDGVARRVERFALASATEKEHGFEREYLLSEVCMSVFCTEVLDYSQEIWERPPAAEVPDPLKLLYRDHRHVVAHATGHLPRRILRFLYDREPDLCRK